MPRRVTSTSGSSGNYIILNPVVGRDGVDGFRGAGQGAATRNGATEQGQRVLAKRRGDPRAGCGCKARLRHFLRCLIPAPRPLVRHVRHFGVHIPRSYNAVRCPKKRAIPSVAQAHPTSEGQVVQKAFVDHSTKLKNEWSTAGFRIISIISIVSQGSSTDENSSLGISKGDVQ
jgi:hypothetical protein